MSEQTTTAALPHERKTGEGMTEDIAAAYTHKERAVDDWYENASTYRDLPIEEDYHAAIAELRRAAKGHDATLSAMVRLLNVAGARERFMAQHVAVAAFVAGYEYAVDAITGKPPAEEAPPAA